MATGFTKYWNKPEKHGVAEVSDMLATTAGHIENVRVVLSCLLMRLRLAMSGQ